VWAGVRRLSWLDGTGAGPSIHWVWPYRSGVSRGLIKVKENSIWINLCLKSCLGLKNVKWREQWTIFVEDFVTFGLYIKKSTDGDYWIKSKLERKIWNKLDEQGNSLFNEFITTKSSKWWLQQMKKDVLL
jgi:hypothetical protein